ncbi:phospholipase D family protein [Lederbergia lenta]|uniref:phospholipase D family protein n=1 Tax=Lederbergia lenta TaxID=1467 RepID=UPI0020407610|nr:phospholipase D family protein [Lederbergia lenta]MCM3112989.1 phospholipase D family protein [Lederbergia lenta]
MVNRKLNKRNILALLILIFLIVYIGTIAYHENKTLPNGISYEGDIHYLSDESVSFLYDLTYKDGGNTKKEQQLFKRIFTAIDEAEQFIVLDLFLYNAYYDKGLNFPKLSSTLTNKLVTKKLKNPNMEIILITDEINTSYGSHENKQFEKMKRNGINVLHTDLDTLRDSNPLYSAIWRMFFQWFGQSGKAYIPNAMADQAPRMTIRSYLKLMNVKANHRKTIATDKTAIILSGNPHDASANHSNIGFELNGPIIADLLKSEQAAANLAGGKKLPGYQYDQSHTPGPLAVQLITEGKVFKAALNAIESAGDGDEVWLAMFYLADRKIINSLLAAHERNADIKIILDPNENAFGAKKTGLPNRPVARELDQKTNSGIQIRWYNTTEEQYHPKLMYIKKKEEAIIIGGSTNFTKRNLDDLNLETNVLIKAPNDTKIITELDHYFHRQWDNENGDFTLDFDTYQDELTPMQRIIYLVQKGLHFTTY